MIITMLAYKPDSDYYCRGCHMASYSSDFLWAAFEDKASAVEFLAQRLFDNKNIDTSEQGYETTVLFDGRNVETMEEEKLLNDIYSKAEEACKVLIIERDRKEQEKARAEKERSEIDERARKEKEFERLKKELGK